MDPRFIFGLVGFLVAGALIDEYDRDKGTNYLWAYTGLIWLVYLTAHRSAFALEMKKIIAATSA